jgi:hypothetical protein
MRELNEVKPSPATEIDILRFGLQEIALMATGSHQADPCYGVRRSLKDYAARILAATEAVR